MSVRKTKTCIEGRERHIVSRETIENLKQCRGSRRKKQAEGRQ